MLCIVTEGGDDSGLIVGLPELEVIAVASALDINSLEVRWKAEQAYKAALRKQQEQERLKVQERLRVTTTTPRGNLSSRALPVKSPASKKQIVLGPPRF